MIINSREYTQADYRQYRVAISTWSDYIVMERKRGKTDNDIRAVILKSGVGKQGVDVVFSAVENGVRYRLKMKRNPKHLFIAAGLIAGGLAVLLISFFVFRNINMIGPALFVAGFGYIGKYFVGEDGREEISE